MSVPARLVAVLEHVEAGGTLTIEDLGYALPLLRAGRSRGSSTVGDKPLRCCRRVFACLYEYREELFLWVCGSKIGEELVPARAVPLREPMPSFVEPFYPGRLPGVGPFLMTSCPRCRDSLMIIRTSTTELQVEHLPSGTTGVVAD